LLIKSSLARSSNIIGINRLAAKGLEVENDGKNNNNSVQYPCSVVNRFECPYEKDNVSSSVNTKKKFNVEDLFELEKMAFGVEFALAAAMKDNSKVQIKDKQELYHALTDRETLHNILEQALDYLLSDEKYIGEKSKQKQDLCEQYRDNKDRILDYFMNVKDKVELE
jgi:hypothetical protein